VSLALIRLRPTLPHIVIKWRVMRETQSMPECRHFPPPWSIEDIGGYFVVKTNNGQPLVFISYREGVARQSIATLLTRDTARRIAAGIAKLPNLMHWLSKPAH